MQNLFREAIFAAGEGVTEMISGFTQVARKSSLTSAKTEKFDTYTSAKTDLFIDDLGGDRIQSMLFTGDAKDRWTKGWETTSTGSRAIGSSSFDRASPDVKADYLRTRENRSFPSSGMSGQTQGRGGTTGGQRDYMLGRGGRVAAQLGHMGGFAKNPANYPNLISSNTAARRSSFLHGAGFGSVSDYMSRARGMSASKGTHLPSAKGKGR